MMSRGICRSWANALFLAIALNVIAGPAIAQTDRSTDKQSDGEFTALAFITDDLEWYAQFARPETPTIEGRSALGRGERGALALLFSNGEPSDGKLSIICDVTAFDPSGSQSVAEGAPCYEGPYGGPNLLHPSLMTLEFEIGPDEPTGVSGFLITARDANSGRAVELEVSFVQGESQ